jgi:hypothetical protein
MEQGLVGLSWREETSPMDRLAQLRARSRHEIEAHEGDLDSTETGRYFIGEASELLAALRLWVQSQYRSDQVVREILEAGDAGALGGVARHLEELGTTDGWAASESVALISNRPSGELMAIAGYALRAM